MEDPIEESKAIMEWYHKKEYDEIKDASDLEIAEVYIESLRYAPILYSKSLRLMITYKTFTFPFGELPIEIQEQIKKLIHKHVSEKLEKEKDGNNERNKS